jgi:acyl carrier protein
MPDSLEQLFADVLNLPPEQINDRTSPANTPGWDSLASVNLTVAIEQEYKIKFATREVMSMDSVGAVKDVLRKKGASGFE